jgi:hypothetical protein
MSLVVVGGHSRNIGKTSVVAGVIAALPQYNWTAMKITQFGHGVCSAAGEPCDCAVEYDHPYAISEESAPGSSDSARFLAAGARRSFWLRTAMGQLGAAAAVIREIVESSENTIVESNSILQFWKPDLYLVVLDFETQDFKESALRYLDRADGVIAVGAGEPQWRGVSRRLWELKPRFPATPPRYVSAELTQFVDARLKAERESGVPSPLPRDQRRT